MDNKTEWIEEAVLELVNSGSFYAQHNGSHTAIRNFYWDDIHPYISGELLGRKPNAIKKYVVNALCAYYDETTLCSNAKPQPTLTKEEPTMSHKLIENKTLINGKDITHMSDSEVFTAIADAEQVIKNLEAIKNQPQKLKDQVTKLKADIALVVKAVDAR